MRRKVKKTELISLLEKAINRHTEREKIWSANTAYTIKNDELCIRHHERKLAYMNVLDAINNDPVLLRIDGE